MKHTYNVVSLLAASTALAFISHATPTFGLTITRNNNGGQLLSNLLGDTTGLSNFSIRLTGDARAFGTFQDDPFGLKSGIVLSTGKVTDLVGKNLSDGGFSPGISIPLTFTKLDGLTGLPSNPGTAVFRADLSGIGVDIQSLSIADSGTGIGGANGKFSGFDLDAIKFSRTSVDSATQVNGLTDLENVFDFSPARTTFTPGTQRPPIDPSQPELDGTLNGNINNAIATLGEFDANPSATGGSVSLGDGGKVGFDLKSSIPAGNPLFLYIGEAGNNEKAPSGNISASNRPISGFNDLSTDFGFPGIANDSISMRIDFDADETADLLYFQYVFGSEEFVEFGGNQFNDAFSLELNGFNFASLSDGATVSTNNLVPSPFGPYHPDFIYNPVSNPASSETKLDGYTKPLTFVGFLEPNARNSLVINVKDVRDGLFDSAVFIKAGTLGTVEPPPIDDGGGNVSVPEPTSSLGILAFGALSTGLLRKKHQQKANHLYN
jgi:hypothetical protein